MSESTDTYPFVPARLRKPAKDAKDQRWMIIWWVHSVREGKLVRRRQGFDMNTIENKRKREQRAADLIASINKLLKKGHVYDPDKLLQQRSKRQATKQNVHRLRPVLEVLDDFRATRADKSHTVTYGYQLMRDQLEEWLRDEECLPNLVVTNFDADRATRFCEWQARRISKRTGRPIGRKTYNNYLVNLGVFCNWLVKKRILKEKEHPLAELTKKKVAKAERHKPYTNEQLRLIMATIAEKGDQQFLLYLQFLYYTFARPRSEVRVLRVGDLRENTIFIRPEHDKNRVGRFVDIPPDLARAIEQAGLRQAPVDSYIFGLGGPAAKPVNKRYFYKKLQAILHRLGLDGQNLDLYGFKHTGNINYYLATRDVYAVMKQNGHTSLTMTQRYLRDLGVLRDEETVNQFPTMGGI